MQISVNYTPLEFEAPDASYQVQVNQVWLGIEKYDTHVTLSVQLIAVDWTDIYAFKKLYKKVWYVLNYPINNCFSL